MLNADYGLGDKNMGFVDDTPMELFLISLVAIVSIYMSAWVYIEFRKNGAKNVNEILKPGALPLGILGAIIVIMGLWGEMVWPLPGAYNILFDDPFMFLGIIVLMMAGTIALKQKLQYVGILAFFAGIISIWYGANAYVDKLTSSPIAMFGLFLAFGLTGVFTFPTTLIYDILPGKTKVSNVWTVVLVLFWIGLVVSAVVAALIGLEAIPAHLVSPP
ncbi:DUF981 family protein [Ferroplasma acidiphilum]|uniref:DUF981 family protein n=1 Tax=Ferroplasma acidiphilum TaxID=74969 RepID=UPI0023F06AE6|nr:DUF981 domain-containing protein [Ferroplasma acidiphilum]MCL4349322.1 DUF981 domain-containing protein [Candidatus Thermoplasmatota archaeon]WMT52581.1 MAG: DUF981 domain-containing protein [Ferroplasma acidiphilum]